MFSHHDSFCMSISEHRNGLVSTIGFRCNREKQDKHLSNHHFTLHIPHQTKHHFGNQCDSIHCAKKQDSGAYHEPKQWDILCGGNIHLWVQDILETSVKLDGYKNNTNLKTVLSRQNTQR